METSKQTDVINDLILINNDRIVGYEKAIENIKEDDANLTSFFQERKIESETFKSELKGKIAPNLVEEGTTNAGKIYRAWMDVKAFFGGDDKKGILKSCEGGEDAAMVAYNHALETEELEPEVRSLIESQHEKIKTAHDKVNGMIEML